MDNNQEYKTATFSFFGKLNDFSSLRRRSQPITLGFRGRQSVKHLIESLGVPHVEIEQIIVWNRRVDFNYLVNNHDWVQVFPYTPPIELPKPTASHHDEVAQFVVDNHLGKLAAYLRMMGFDTSYRNDIQDDELARIASQDERILLTRDQRLLMRACIHYGYWVRNKIPQQQIREVMQRWNLAPFARPFRRCIRCNGLLQMVEKEQIQDQLQPLTKKYFEEFRICPNCQQIYWKGSHFEKMQTFLMETLGDQAN